jgi:hypothetical protein
MPVYAAKGCTDVGAKQLSDSQHAIRDLGALKPRRSCTAHRAQDNIAQCFSFLPSLTAAGVGEPAAGNFAGRATLLPASRSNGGGFTDEVGADVAQCGADVAAQDRSTSQDESRDTDDHQGVLGCAHAFAISQDAPEGECHSLQHGLISFAEG